MNKAMAAICIVLGVVLLACLGFGVYVLLEASDYFKTKPTDFWVTIDGNRYYVEADELVLSDADIEVHYLVDWLTQKQGYSYKIVPAGNDFGYIVNGTIGNFLGIEDLTSAFEFEESESGFTIKAKDKTITDVLQAVYPNGNVVVADTEDADFHFKLVVTSVDGKEVALTFRCAVAVDGIEIDQPAIIF